MLKIIFERIPDLQPWGMLFGDEVYTSNSFTSRLKRRLNIKNIELKESEKVKHKSLNKFIPANNHKYFKFAIQYIIFRI